MAAAHEWGRLFRKTKKEQRAPDEDQKLLEDIREVRRQLDGIAAYFALESDEDLLEAAIFQHTALEVRYRYLLRLARQTNAVAAAPALIAKEQERMIN